MNHAITTDRSSLAFKGDLLRGRFIRLWARCVSPGVQSDPVSVWNGITNAYGESHRYYHNKEHLTHCMFSLDSAVHLIKHRDRVEMALWFHDIVNRPGEADNEARSATLFRDVAGQVMPSDFVEAVTALVLATVHQDCPTDLDGQFICDIDLAGFGRPWNDYVQDTLKLRAEFPGSDLDYYLTKRAFLEGLLRRPQIFFTEFFRNRHERRARDNIRRLLAQMDRGDRKLRQAD